MHNRVQYGYRLRVWRLLEAQLYFLNQKAPDLVGSDQKIPAPAIQQRQCDDLIQKQVNPCFILIFSRQSSNADFNLKPWFEHSKEHKKSSPLTIFSLSETLNRFHPFKNSL